MSIVVGEQGRRRVRPLVVLKAAVRIIPQPPLEQRERNSRAARELRGSDDHETHNLLFCFLGLAVTRKPKQASFFLVKRMSAAPTGPTAPMGPRTYSEYYGNAGLDPYEENYAALMMQFRTANNPPTGGDLRSAVGNSDPAYPAAFLGLYKDEAGEARYRVIHAVARFPSMIGRATPWDGRQFGFASDVFEGSATTIEMPANAFDFHRAQMMEENVPGTLERARELLDQSPDEDFLGPFADGDANTRQARTRTLIPLPHRYVRLMLDRQPKAREGFID